MTPTPEELDEAVGNAREVVTFYETAHEPDMCHGPSDSHLLARAVIALAAENERLTATLNTPITEDFSRGVEAEAAHQRDRWGSEHDAGKRPEDWIALCVYLLGKATKAHYEGDSDKYLHHLISTAAVLANAHAHETGVDTRMRPGVSAEHAWRPAQTGNDGTKKEESDG